VPADKLAKVAAHFNEAWKARIHCFVLK
jgi:hypothetical protein